MDPEDAVRVSGLVKGVALGILLMCDRLAILNRIGNIIQHSVSEQSSDSLEDRYCVNTVHSTAAQTGPAIGSMSSNPGFLIVVIGISGELDFAKQYQ